MRTPTHYNNLAVQKRICAVILNIETQYHELSDNTIIKCEVNVNQSISNTIITSFRRTVISYSVGFASFPETVHHDPF